MPADLLGGEEHVADLALHFVRGLVELDSKRNTAPSHNLDWSVLTAGGRGTYDLAELVERLVHVEPMHEHAGGGSCRQRSVGGVDMWAPHCR
jgi:hypothetical protein